MTKTPMSDCWAEIARATGLPLEANAQCTLNARTLRLLYLSGAMAAMYWICGFDPEIEWQMLQIDLEKFGILLKELAAANGRPDMEVYSGDHEGTLQ